MFIPSEFAVHSHTKVHASVSGTDWFLGLLRPPDFLNRLTVSKKTG